ncbi:hypothetical protein Tco_0157621 [Tanacetum coccineum]
MVKNLENVSGKFLMYPRFVQVFLEKQLEGMPNHKRIYVTLSYTKKIFGNIRRVWKGFSGRDTPLFPTMKVQAQQEQGEGSGYQQKDRNPSQNDKTEHGMEKTVQNQGQSPKMPKSESIPSSGSGPRRQETIGDTIAQTGFENVSKTSNDSLLAGGRHGDEEMFDTSVLDGDEVLAEPEVTVKDVNLSVDEVTLAQALADLKSEKVQKKANVVEEPSESITTTPTLTTTTTATTTTATTITAVSTRPKAKGLVIHEEEQTTTPTVSSQQPSQVKARDKGKGIMVEEPMKMKKGDQISLDEELAFKLQIEEEKEEERLAKEKDQREEEANIVA